MCCEEPIGIGLSSRLSNINDKNFVQITLWRFHDYDIHVKNICVHMYRWFSATLR